MPRERIKMSEDIKEALETSGTMNDFLERPPYQQNDYMGWIMRAKKLETREKRIAQMIDELHRGGVYMNNEHKPSRKA